MLLRTNYGITYLRCACKLLCPNPGTEAGGRPTRSLLRWKLWSGSDRRADGKEELKLSLVTGDVIVYV